MDMTSLSSTLPGNSSRRPNQPPKQLSPDPNDDSQSLIEAFQSAARSVTNLYRSSASLIRNSRQDGYTDALSDVLEAIDNESAYKDPALALSRIRDWVIDRRHEIKGGSNGGPSLNGGNVVGGGRSSSMPPQQQREMSSELEMDDGNAKEEESRTEESERRDVAYPDLPSSQQQQQQTQSQIPHLPSLQPIPFSFQSLNPIPQYPTQTPGVVEPLQSPDLNGIFTFNSPVINSRPGAGNNKVPLASRVNNTTLGTGAGTKRRGQYLDFFDLNGFGNFGMNGLGNNGSGPGNAKRGRFV
ncbi:hypothetical protein TWF694_003751 [Orbilia ellipsospora]|uniref:Uncharacterized protein n=1 Tax=Orbilia ellipsospora TaxID=2528407 RepID=A0AAV9WZY8_9PEZI